MSESPDENTRDLLIRIAGYLTMIAKGYQPSPSPVEAIELLDQIGEVLEAWE